MPNTLFFLNFTVTVSLKTVENGQKKIIGISNRNGNERTNMIRNTMSKSD